MNNPQLMALKIPMKWLIQDNKFYDTDPICDDLQNGWIENWHEGFSEDVLLIESTIDPKLVFQIILDWKENNRIWGEYHAQFSVIDSEKEDFLILEHFSSKNRFEIAREIGNWLDYQGLNWSEFKDQTLQKLRNNTST